MGSGLKSLTLQDEDQSGSRPDLFPGSLYLNSGMSPEHFRSELGVVDSEEIHLAVTRRPKRDFQSN